MMMHFSDTTFVLGLADADVLARYQPTVWATHMLVFTDAAHGHGGSYVLLSIALCVNRLETPLAVAVSARFAQTVHRILFAHGALHLRVRHELDVRFRQRTLTKRPMKHHVVDFGI